MSKSTDVADKLDALLDELAHIEHERWAYWQSYMHGKGTLQPDGSLLIPRELVDRWERQIATPFTELTEQEKESDRDQVKKYLPIIKSALET